MRLRSIPRPYRYAADGNYGAGPYAWNNQPRAIAPSDAQLSAGLDQPREPYPTQAHNWLNSANSDALTLRAHDAICSWRKTPVASHSNSSIILASALINVSDTNTRLVAYVSKGASTYLAALANVASATNENPGSVLVGADFTIERGLALNETIHADPGDRVTVLGSTDFSTLTTYAITGNSDFTLGAFALYGGRYVVVTKNHIYSRATLAAGVWDALNFGQHIADPGEYIGCKDFAEDEAGTGCFIMKYETDGVLPAGADLYTTTDGGVSWTLQISSLSEYANVCWSQFYGRFVLIDNGEINTSVDGLTWSHIYDVAQFAGNLQDRHYQLAACGPAIAIIAGGGSGGAEGGNTLYYSFDLGATWFEYVLAYNETVPQSIRAINGRFYIASTAQIWESGLLEIPYTAPFTGSVP